MKIFDFFRQVTWLSDADICKAPCFSDLAIRYGFTGKNDEPPLVYRPDQVHGVDIVKADNSNCFKFGKLSYKADAIYTLQKDLPIAVVTADCMSLLLTDINFTFVMAVHAGWRSLSQGILLEAVKVIQGLNVPSQDLRVLIGPTITACSYEVGSEVIDAFRSQKLDLTESELSISTLKGVHDKWSIDLQSVAVCLLSKYSILPRNINIVRSCTYANPDKWHSFRREALRAKRNYAFISKNL